MCSFINVHACLLACLPVRLLMSLCVCDLLLLGVVVWLCACLFVGFVVCKQLGLFMRLFVCLLVCVIVSVCSVVCLVACSFVCMFGAITCVFVCSFAWLLLGVLVWFVCVLVRWFGWLPTIRFVYMFVRLLIRLSV